MASFQVPTVIDRLVKITRKPVYYQIKFILDGLDRDATPAAALKQLEAGATLAFYVCPHIKERVFYQDLDWRIKAITHYPYEPYLRGDKKASLLTLALSD